ncbi:hypothetical protein EAI_16695 [Harpegnathos saltator]|uniref:Uncharacterized protein n=1 Tax=Harpegnathos saltator TaxID=610380 RepID=E2BGH1_HARSA|nr:hypothetical protein EAI_16695 [Harpegnathos saltator]
MWKLSQLTLRRYIMRNEEEVSFAPMPGYIDDLTKTYLQQSKANINRNIASHHRSCLQMEKAANFALAEEKEELAKIKTKLFDTKQSLTKYIAEASVAISIKQRLADVEDSEVIETNCSMVSLPSTMQANSFIIGNTTGKISHLWDHNLDITARSLFNLSEKPLTTIQCTPTKQSTLQDTIEKTTDVFDRDFKITKPELDELTEVEFVNDNSVIVKQESTSRRRSISDLVERYKKVLETSNCAIMKFQKECMAYETE